MGQSTVEILRSAGVIVQEAMTSEAVIETAQSTLGLALAQPERWVIVITDDGEMLMGLGSLATIAV